MSETVDSNNSLRKKKEKAKVVFFDLSRMTKIVTKEDKQQAYIHMMGKLSLE
jgi:hypothetical protein